MSQIHVDKEEFADIVLTFLMEAVRDEEFIKNNPRFREVIEFAEQRGIKSKLVMSYFHMGSETRIKYKKIKDTFYDGETAKINIGTVNKQVSESFDRDLCKRIFRKVKDVRFKTSMPITEERLDKIIDYCIKEKEEQNG